MSEKEREFQIALLETQISCEGHDTLFSLIAAVGYSVAISMYGFALTNIADYLKTELLITSTIILILAIASFVKYEHFHKYVVPKKMQDLRNRFLKPQPIKTEEQSSREEEKTEKVVIENE
jgi:hypothetical protein